MTTIVPRDLLTATKEGRVVLFLGAGASQGAPQVEGRSIPTGNKLAQILSSEFLGDEYSDLDLRTAYDLSCTKRDVRTIQKKLFEIFNPFQPANFHLIIPSLPWAGMATTNYDLIIERAFDQAQNKLQNLVLNVRDGDGSIDQIESGKLLYVKLHGCITCHQTVAPPMVTSTEQLIHFKDGRNGQFGTFLEWAKTKTMLFVGYSFLDPNLRALFDEIVKEGDNRPRHYIANKGIRDIEQQYWRDRRVEALDCSFQALLEEFDSQIPKNYRVLGSAIASSQHATTFTRFISKSGERESEELKQYLTSTLDHIDSTLDPVTANPRRFYSGFDLGWYPIAADLDVRQPLVDQVLGEQIAAVPSTISQSLVVIKGHAGSGKTIALRRICWEAAKRYDRLCFFFSRQNTISLESFREIFGLTNVPIFLFVDNIADHRDKILPLMNLARTMKSTIKLVATETYPTWNATCDDLEPFVNTVYDMQYLSEANIVALIEKLKKHDCLGYLSSLSFDMQMNELKHVHGRQILVALLEATQGQPFTDIIAQEYRDIPSAQARLLYLDICSLHRFGPPVRAGLLSRVHNISFEDFKEKLFKPLESVVHLRLDSKSGDYVYEARHSYIAHTVYESAVKTEAERFDGLVRILRKLNVSYSYDLEVIGKIIRAENLERTLTDHMKIRQIYDVAEEHIGARSVLFHQRGLFEMHVANNLGGLDVAERCFLKAIELDPRNRSIKHSYSELDLKRSRLSTDSIQREAWRRSAASRASELANGNSPYPHHTLLKLAVDAVKDALANAEEEDSEATSRVLSDSITKAEDVLKRGRQAFPNESILLSEEGELSKVLSNAVRAERSFEKAFVANPRSTLIAKRLARIKRSKSDYPGARTVLQKCLEHNPGAQDVHYDLAMTVLESSPVADQQEYDFILYHFRRSFSAGDNNKQAQFWYARQLCIGGEYDEARSLFRDLSDARLPYRDKNTVRGHVLEVSGSKKVFSAIVKDKKETFGFVRIDDLKLDAYLRKFEFEEEENFDLLIVGDSLKCQLAFTLFGPIALKVMV